MPWAVAGSAAIPLAVSLGMGVAFTGRGAMAWLERVVFARLRWQWLRTRALSWRAGAASVDVRLARIGSARKANRLASAVLLGCWLLESLETAVLLCLVGAPLDVPFAMAAEVGISLVRSAASVGPAGFGLQDAGYAALLPAMGLSAEAAAAFVLVRRGKEMVCVVFGYGLLALLRRRVAGEAGSERSGMLEEVGGAKGRAAVT